MIFIKDEYASEYFYDYDSELNLACTTFLQEDALEFSSIEEAQVVLDNICGLFDFKIVEEDRDFKIVEEDRDSIYYEEDCINEDIEMYIKSLYNANGGDKFINIIEI
jgi:hypothetical protein